nr:MAG TPA: hypothetical protein [Microviridae sp.]
MFFILLNRSRTRTKSRTRTNDFYYFIIYLL